MLRSIFSFIFFAVLMIGGGSVFIVDQTEQAIVTQFGEPRRAMTNPGLYFKLPFIQNVITFDKRVLALDSQPMEAIAADQKRLIIDTFARYKIENPLRYFQATGGIVARGNQQLSTFTDAALRRVVGESNFQSIVKDDRAELAAKIREQVDVEAKALGVTIVDIRIRRVDLPEQNSQAIFGQMQTERQREAAEFRAQGTEASDKIRAGADRAVVVIKADADRQSREVLGQGEGERIKILAEAYEQDPEFFAFIRSLQAYEHGLKAGDTRLIISPQTPFFQYFNDPYGKKSPK